MADNPYFKLVDQDLAAGIPPVVPAANDNPYMDLAKQDLELSQQRLKGVLDIVSPVNPDHAAEALKLSRTSGLPQQTVQDNLDDVRRQERVRLLNLQRMMADSPVLARQLNDPVFASIAQDQTEQMGNIEMASSYVGRSLQSGGLQLTAAATKLMEFFTPTTSEEDLATLFKNNPAGLKDMRENGAASALSRWARAQQTMANTIMEGMPAQVKAKYGNLEYLTTDTDNAAYLSPVKMIGDVVNSLPTTIALMGSMYLTKSAAGSTLARLEPLIGREAAMREATKVAAETMAYYSAVSEGAVGYAQQTNQTRAEVDKISQATLEKSPAYQDLVTVQGYSPEAARIYLSATTAEKAGTMAGLVDAITNFYGGRFLGKLINEGGALAPRIGKGFLTEGLTEAPQSMGEQFAQNLAVQQGMNPDQSLSEGVGEAGAAGFVVGGLTGGAFSGVFGRAQETVQQGQESAMRANQMFGLLNSLNDMASASKVRERDVQTFEGFMQSVEQEAGPVNMLYIDPKTLVETLQSAGANVRQVAEGLPSMANLDEQLKTGTLVAIPVSEFAARIAGTDYAQALMPHLQGDPSGMSKVQADEFMQNHGENLKAEVEKVLAERQGDEAFKGSMEKVKQQVLDEITNTQRFTKDVNESYATLMSTFYGVTAAKLGITPEEMAARYPIKVSAEGVNQGQQYDQAGNLKTETPQFKSFFGQSKVVDAAGNPLVVYHGTRPGNDIAQFEAPNKRDGIYFTPDAKYAEGFTEELFSNSEAKGAIYPVYLSVKNPYVVRAQDMESEEAQSFLYRGLNRADLEAQGYDGAMLYIGDELDQVMAFSPEQIKSAIGNNGDFDATNPNILMQDNEVAKEYAEEDAKEEEISDDVEAGTQGVVPTTVDDQAVLDSTLKLAKSKVWNKGRDLKLAIQEAVQNAAQAAGVDVSLPSPQSTEYLVRTGVKDALFALQQNPNAIGWYDVKTRQALSVMSLVHPEIATDQNARFAFVWALAVTSNGMKVGKNFELAEAAYEAYKKTGAMPTDIQAGQAQKAINESLALFNELKASWGIDDLRRFMLTNFTVGEIAAISKDLKPGGEHAATFVKGAAILGPKIGNGFFSNLYGNFDALTMDRWLVRTWGRWTGTLIKPQPVQTAKARERLSAARDAVAGDAKLQEIVGTQITKDTPVDELAVAIQEASTDPKLRSQMNETEAGTELRKAGNSLAKYLDGQKEAPAGPNERNYIRAVFADMLAELQQRPEYADLTMADLQAVLWYAEKRLYETAKSDVDEEDATEGYTDEDAPDYANAAAAVARAKGVSDRKIQNAFKKEEQNGRTGDARSADVAGQAQAGGQQAQAVGFTGSEKRLFVGAVAVHRARSHRAGNVESSATYTRASDKRRGDPGLLKPRSKKDLGVTYTAEWKPGKSLGTIFKANGIATPTFYELVQGDEKNAQRFADAITASKQASGAVGAAVYVYPTQDYQGMRLFLSKDGSAGVAVKADGDIVSVFASGGAGRSVMELAVAVGGTKLDAFDTILPTYYAAHGFVAASRLGWDDSQAPEGWSKEALARYNKGEPDVVFMVLDKAYMNGYSIKDGKRLTDYDKAVATQERLVKKLAPLNATLYQGEEAARGKIAFGQDITQTPSVITLFKSANLSTFLHESGHFFLEVTADIASRPDAPKEIQDDMQTILKWFGVQDLATWKAMDLEARRPLHEKFARGFEAYLFEGKSPSMELNGIFQRFRAWLVNVYKQVAKLNVEIDDEIRGVFDRMVASTEAIQEAEQARTYVPLFTTKPPFMTDEEWLAYQQSDAQASQDAVQYLEQRSLRDMQWVSNAKARLMKAMQKENSATRKDVRREVETEVMAEPVYRAREFLKRGTVDGQPVEGGYKLSIAEIESMYGDNPIVGMIKERLGFGKYGMLGTDNGIHPQQVADMFGFSSGDHLVRSLLEAPDPAGVINERTDARMLERYGDLNSPEALSKAADEAIHNDARAKFVATEANALAKATGRPKILAAAAKDFAQQLIARLKIRNIRPGQYAASASRAAKNAAKSKDLIEAATEKRNQLINTYAAKAAFEAQQEVIRAVRYFRRFESKNIYKSVHVDYLEQIHALLERFDLRTSTTLTEIDKRASLIRWVESQRAKGIEPVIAPELLDEAYKISYKDMSLEDFRGLVDAVKNIEHLGRLKDKLLKIQDQREFRATATEAGEVIRENATTSIPQQLEKVGIQDAVTSTGREVFAFHRKFASLIRQMDGFKDGGKLWSIFSRPMNEAGAMEATMREQATVKLGELYKLLGKVNLKQKLFIPEIGGSLSLEGRLAIALNMGNETNMRRVMEGENWNPAQVNAVIGSLTREQWNFVQGTWDFLNSYWPEISAKERRMTGITPEKVEARPFVVTLKDGTQMSLNGGYYPIKYNPARSSKAEADTAAEVLKQMERGLYTRAQTARGHIEARVESVGRPMRYDLGVIDQHLNQVIHDLSWHEYLVDANRLLRSDPVDSAIREHYGPEVLSTMRHMMEDIAIGEIPTMNVVERGVRWVRSGVSIASMGWNLITAFTQPLGLTQSMVRVGPKWVAKGMGRWLRDASSMESTVQWITGKSEFMRVRAKTQQREISEIRNTIQKGETRSAVEGSFFYLIGKLQLVADVPTWLGMYEKAMAENPDEARAIAMADQAVLDSQGGGQIKDLSQAQRGNEWQKLWTNFYSFFNVTYNQLAETVGETRLVGPSRLPLLAVDVLMLTVVPATLGFFLKAALKGKDLDDEDKLAKELVAENISYLMGTMIGLRELNAAVSGSMGYEGPAGARFFADVAKLVKQAEQGEADEAFWRAANELGGVLLHYPALQIDRTVRGIIAMSDGSTENPIAPLVGPPPKN